MVGMLRSVAKARFGLRGAADDDRAGDGPPRARGGDDAGG